MSLVFGKGDILFEQRLLACGGFYDGKLDGLWGPKSEAAAKNASVTYNAMRNAEPWDVRSEDNISTLLPMMQREARGILKAANAWCESRGYVARIISGTRTYAEQNALAAQTKPKVTNARGGQSNHNFGIAVDLGLFTIAGKYLTGATKTEERAYVDIAAYVKPRVKQIEWGGDWATFKDTPHYQLATGKTISQVRTLFEKGKPFV